MEQPNAAPTFEWRTDFYAMIIAHMLQVLTEFGFCLCSLCMRNDLALFIIAQSVCSLKKTQEIETITFCLSLNIFLVYLFSVFIFIPKFLYMKRY
jgi:hypothetical protein